MSTGEQAIIHQDQTMFQARVTYQASPRNKIGFTYDHEALCSCPNQISATVSPEASVDRRFPLQRFIQMDWNNPLSNRLLLEASAIHRVERWGAHAPSDRARATTSTPSPRAWFRSSTTRRWPPAEA